MLGDTYSCTFRFTHLSIHPRDAEIPGTLAPGMWEVLSGRGGPWRAPRVLERPEVPEVPVTLGGPGVPRGSRPVSGPRCAVGGAFRSSRAPPPPPCALQPMGRRREGRLRPRAFKAAPRARRRQRGERPLGRRLRRHGLSARPATVSPAASGPAALALSLLWGRGLVGAAAHGREGALLGSGGRWG